jgi:hypothetical protein
LRTKALANFSDPLRRDQYFELYGPEIVLHGYGVVEPGIDSVKHYYYGFWGAIPDARVAAEDIIEKQFIGGDTFRYLGRQYRLKLVYGEPATVRLSRPYLIASLIPETKRLLKTCSESGTKEGQTHYLASASMRCLKTRTAASRTSRDLECSA